jgi:anti-sigma regulatory factor (Ser/Thr protein kinase)
MSSSFLVVDSPQIVCVCEPGQALTQVLVRGGWDGGLRQEVSRVLRACVAEAPRVLLLDLSQLQDPAGESVSTWLTAVRYARQSDPQVVLGLGAAPPAVRRRLSTGDGDPPVVLADTVDAALAVVPSLDGDGKWQHHMPLQAQPMASALARTMVSDACLAFDVAYLVRPARLIVSELVTNAVLHTGTDLDVWASARGAALHLAVQDRSRDFPQLLDVGHRHPAAFPESGMGLRTVTATATAWGALPCRHGKVVWATLATRAETAS